MTQLDYIILDLKRWMQCDIEDTSHPIDEFLTEEGKRLAEELWKDILGYTPHDPDLEYEQLISAGVANLKIFTEGEGYFESLVYHRTIKYTCLNAAHENAIFISSGGNSPDLQSLITPTQDSKQSLINFQRIMQNYFAQWGVTFAPINPDMLTALPYDSSDPYAVSRKTCLPFPDDWQENIDLQRIRPPNEELPLVERIKNMREEYHGFYTMFPLIKLQIATSGATELEVRMNVGI